LLGSRAWFKTRLRTVHAGRVPAVTTGGFMATLDLAIRGGTVVTAADIFRADIGVEAGRIVTIGDTVKGAAREIDASGLLVLPGGIDSHVHIAQPAGPGIVMADDFASAAATPA
jgi:dihydropyrimidinase